MQALHLTPAAVHWLQTTTTAQCLSLHQQVVNFINQENAVLALVTQRRLLVPFALEIEVDRKLWEAITPQSPVRVDRGVLGVGPLEVAWEGAQMWNPRPDWAAVQARLAAHPQAVRDLIAWARPLAAPASLLHFDQWPASPLARRFALGLRLLADGLRARDEATALSGVEQLVGVGSGLTPAGDDFLLGVLLALWAGQQRQLAPGVTRTTALSVAFLQAAARGECALIWHELFQVLGADAVRTQRAGQALLAFGHTSGADALAGLGWAFATLTEQ